MHPVTVPKSGKRKKAEASRKPAAAAVDVQSETADRPRQSEF